MKKLHCDIQLGGSSSQYLKWNKTNSTKEEFIKSLTKQLTHNAKTIPSKYATRCASIMGIIYDKFNGDPYLLDVLITAIHNANKIVCK